MSVSELKIIDPLSTTALTQAASEKPVVLALENVSKRFCRDLKRSLFYGVQDIAREVVGMSQNENKLRKNEFWAVRGISLELRSGDALGIVGINGCGKTTLMRIIAGLIKPTTGRVTVQGRLAPLLALGAGFNPVLTGRENIFANMSILGLTYEEIQERFEEVVEFCEIGYAIDAPVQTYSSGMVARLGFACAISTQPDILLLDEVLAVGDLNFRRKCLEKLFQMRSAGMSLVMVHHSPGILMTIADQALYLRKGHLKVVGEISTVIQQYERDLVKDMPSGFDAASDAVQLKSMVPESSAEAELMEIIAESVNGGPVVAGKDAVIRASFKIKQPVNQINFAISVIRLPSLESVDDKPKRILRMLSHRDGGSLSEVQPGEYEVRIELPAVGLREGLYKIGIKIARPVRVPLASGFSPPFVVSSNEVGTNEFYQRRSWSVIANNGSQLPTRKFLHSVENADELLVLDDKDRPE